MGKEKTIKVAVLKRDTAVNELFIKPIQGLYKDQTISVEEFKERNATLMKNRWIDTQHGSSGEKIYELYDPNQEGELIKESLQEWLCDNRNEITQCIGIALRNHEKSYANGLDMWTVDLVRMNSPFIVYRGSMVYKRQFTTRAMCGQLWPIMCCEAMKKYTRCVV